MGSLLNPNLNRFLVAFFVIFVSFSKISAADKTTYDDHVVPILRNHCLNCHNPDKKKADFDASSYNGIMTGAGSGKVLTPEDPGSSRLWRVINHLEEPNMPPKGPKIPDAELVVIKKWIEGGLLENTGSKALTKPKVDLAVPVLATGKPEGPPPMPNGDLLLEPVVHASRVGAVNALAASPWAPLVAIAGQKQVVLYHLDTFNIEGILPFPEGFPYVVKFSRSGKLLLVGGGIGAKMGKVVLFDVTTGRRITEIGSEYDAVIAADISPDQTQVALGGPSKVVNIYSIATGELQHAIKKHTDWVTAIAFSPDGVLLGSADRSGGVYLWEAATANTYSELRSSSPQKITDLAWRDDSNVMATTGDDGRIRGWGVENSDRVLNITAHSGGVQAMRFSHDGRVVSTGRDRITKLWDTSGNQQRAFEAFSDLPLAVAISHDMTKVIGGDYTGEVRIWNAADGKLLGKLDANPPTLAQRIEGDEKRLTEAKANHEKLAAAHVGAGEAQKKAAAAVETSRKRISETTAATKAAEGAVGAAKKAFVAAEAAHKAATEAQAAFTQATSQKALDDAQAALSSAEANLKAATDAHQKAVAAADAATKALPAAEAEAKAASEALAKAKAQMDSSSPQIAGLERNVARWKAAQFNIQVLSAADSLAAKQAIADAALAKAEELKAVADRAAANLASTKKAIADGPTLVNEKNEQVSKANSALEAAKAAVPSLTNTLAAKQSEAASASAALEKASNELASSQAALKIVQETATSAANTAKLATDTAAKAKAAAERFNDSTIQRFNDLAAQATAAVEAARQAVAEIESQLKRATDTQVQAKAAADTAAQAATTAQQALTKQAEAIKAAEAAVASANEALTKTKATVEELPKKLPTLEKAAADTAAAATAARETATKAAAELTPLKQQHEQLVAKYQQMKPKS